MLAPKILKLEQFDYYLPPNLIAQKPSKPRDHSRLMILNRDKKTIKHDYFYNLPQYLDPGSCLVANNSKVIPARLIGEKDLTQGKIEILLLEETKKSCWKIMLKGKGHSGLKINFKNIFSGILEKQLSEQTWLMQFSKTKNFFSIIEKIGQTPLPPYIKEKAKPQEYQTIYAQKLGSAAAPTAGFHFTSNLIQTLKQKKIKLEFITLHVGLGTFQPVRVTNIREHQMHAEWGEVEKKVTQNLNQIKNQGQKIIAIGTTSCRVLESFSNSSKKIKAQSKKIQTFIYPGYKFKFIDGLITNFHLPKSTLLMLVSAFAGRKFILQAYQEAIQKKYRFYSFGDAMLIL
ncbi:tRNA preQ1(34) S-adenosylmethionine ribosyltransferase-isomerase QueA [Patescibacteria group bacterium]|nr:tRNA preQ1(34) S-adenosylmethionine ribosyltransferase-isomerase QueA [Patescibacteria group bacterium]